VFFRGTVALQIYSVLFGLVLFGILRGLLYVCFFTFDCTVLLLCCCWSA